MLQHLREAWAGRGPGQVAGKPGEGLPSLDRLLFEPVGEAFGRVFRLDGGSVLVQAAPDLHDTARAVHDHLRAPVSLMFFSLRSRMGAESSGSFRE